MERKILTALASFGMSGQVFHAPLLHVHPGFGMKKILERTHQRSVARYPYIEVVKSWEEILLDPAIELVIVNTPDHLHFSMAMDALKAGKHVVVEKPFTQTAREAELLIDEAKHRNKILSVYHNRRWDGSFLTFKEIIHQGLLGRLVTYEAHYDRYRNIIADSWKEQPETGASILYNLGSHLIDQTLSLFGMPKAVWADTRIQRPGAKVIDSYELKMEYADLVATLVGSYLVREPGPRHILHGTEGSFIKCGTDPQEEALKAGQWPEGEGWGREQESDWGLLNTQVKNLHFRGKIETLPGNYVGYYDTIYEAIVHGKPLAVSAADGLNVIRVIEAALQSKEEKGWIEIRTT
jgi:scyllo-inositol 2-dehydrogenase (NADP+)